MNNVKNKSRKFKALWPLLILAFYFYCFNIQAMEKFRVDHQKVELKGLSGDKLLALCLAILEDKTLRDVLDRTLADHIIIDKEKVIRLNFSVACDFYDLAYKKDYLPEAREAAAQLSALYFIRALVLGDENARALLIFSYPKVKTLLENWGPDLSSLDEARFNLLVKIAYDYWVYHKKRPDKNPREVTFKEQERRA